MCNDYAAAELIKDEKGGNRLKIGNTTPYDAVAAVMAEHSKIKEKEKEKENET